LLLWLLAARKKLMRQQPLLQPPLQRQHLPQWLKQPLVLHQPLQVLPLLQVLP
jgi:hypothetical protein